MKIETFFTKEGIKKFLKSPEGRTNFVAIVLFLALVLTLVVTPSTKATSSTYYFDSCLGKWRNVSNAEGEPDLEEDAPESEYNLGNSAVLYSALDSIFCGELDDAVPEKDELEKVTLKLQIAFSNDPLRNPPKIIEEEEVVDENIEEDLDLEEGVEDDIASSTESDDSSIDQNSGEDIVADELVDEETTVASTTEQNSGVEGQTEVNIENQTDSNASTTNDSSDLATSTEETINTATSSNETASVIGINSNLANIFGIKFVNAEEVVVEDQTTEETAADPDSPGDQDFTEITTEAVPSKEKENSSGNANKNKNADEGKENSEEKSLNNNKDLTEDTATSTDGDTTTSEEGVGSDGSSVSEEEQYFLEVFYTLDGGRTLISLDKISATNWIDKDFEYDIPLENWDEVRKFQVSLHGIDAVENQPIVYLDSAWIVVEHLDDTPDEEEVVKGTPANFEEDKLIDLKNSDEFTAEEEIIFENNNTRDRTCVVEPFSLEIERGGSGRYELQLSEFEKPYRLISSNAPEGITLERYFEEDLGVPHEYIKVDISEDTQFKSITLQVLFQIQERRHVVSSAVCSFNVEVKDEELVEDLELE